MNISTRYNRLSPKTSSRSQPKIRTRAEGRAERLRLGCADRLYPTTLSAGRGLTNTCPIRIARARDRPTLCGRLWVFWALGARADQEDEPEDGDEAIRAEIDGLILQVLDAIADGMGKLEEMVAMVY